MQDNGISSSTKLVDDPSAVLGARLAANELDGRK